MRLAKNEIEIFLNIPLTISLVLEISVLFFVTFTRLVEFFAETQCIVSLQKTNFKV
jgi:hypothetical protein